MLAGGRKDFLLPNLRLLSALARLYTGHWTTFKTVFTKLLFYTLLSSPSHSIKSSMAFQALHGPSGAFKGLPKDFQGLPGPSEAFKGLQRVRQDLQGPSGAVLGLPKDFKKSSNAFQDL